METDTLNKSVSLSETIRTIYQRRAVRKYTDRPVDRELIEEVIDAGRMAPSAINHQPWQFYVLTDRKLIHSLSKEIAGTALKEFVKPGLKGAIKQAGHLLHFSDGFHFQALKDPVFHGAPVVIFITAPRDNEWAPLDIGMCSQNMMLAARSLGLDTCPVGFGKFVEGTEMFTKLRVPASEHVLLSIIVGYGDEHPELPERAKNNIHFID
ncbi:MAG: nitroreductase [Puia sp.]|nr:nitroreductase [Puia sp.]